MSTSAYTISAFVHRKAQAATTCPQCGAAPSQPCTGVETVTIGHYARAHLYLVAGKPPPDDTAIADLTRVDGIRADTKPFVAWLSGEYDFRSCGASGRGLTLRVYLATGEDSVANVRIALVDTAARHGLVVSHGSSGRTRYVVTERGLEFYKQHHRPTQEG